MRKDYFNGFGGVSIPLRYIRHSLRLMVLKERLAPSLFLLGTLGTANMKFVEDRCVGLYSS